MPASNRSARSAASGWPGAISRSQTAAPPAISAAGSDAHHAVAAEGAAGAPLVAQQDLALRVVRERDQSLAQVVVVVTRPEQRHRAAAGGRAHLRQHDGRGDLEERVERPAEKTGLLAGDDDVRLAGHQAVHVLSRPFARRRIGKVRAAGPRARVRGRPAAARPCPGSAAAPAGRNTAPARRARSPVPGGLAARRERAGRGPRAPPGWRRPAPRSSVLLRVAAVHEKPARAVIAQGRAIVVAGRADAREAGRRGQGINLLEREQRHFLRVADPRRRHAPGRRLVARARAMARARPP